MSIQNNEVRENGEAENFYGQNIVRIEVVNGNINLIHYQSLHGEPSARLPHARSIAFPASMLGEIKEVLDRLTVI
jgi:hypothetical protein